MKTHILLIAIGLMLVSCNNSTSSGLLYHIDIENSITNINSIPLSTLGSKLEYVPLETDTTCLIQKISNVSITDSLIFICDYDRLLKFNMKGKFLKQIGAKGRGPGEYSSLGDFLIDETNREIFVLSSRIVIVYDFDGNYKRDFKFDFPCKQFVFNKYGELVFHPFNFPTPGADKAYSWYVFDRTGTIVKKIENTLPRINKGIVIPVSPLYKYNDIPYFMEFGIDTLYEYDNNEKNPYAVFHLGNLKFPTDPTMSEVPKIKGKVVINEIRETKKLFLINLLSDSILNCIYDKTLSEFSVLKNGDFTNDIDGGVAFWPKKIISDNLMLDYIDAFDLISYSRNIQKNSNEKISQLNNVISQLSETSNPVIIILRK